MIDRDEASSLLDDEGHLFLDDGSDAGLVRRVFLDDYSGWPSFATVDAFGAAGESFVALHEAELAEGGIAVPYDHDKVAGAPRVDHGQDLTVSEEDSLFAYYGVPIDGVVPVVDHLGAVFVPHPDGSVEARPVDHPTE